MDRIRVIPGAISQNSIRALVLAAGQGEPEVVVRRSEGGDDVRAIVVPLQVSQAMQTELDRDGVRLFSASTSGLRPGTGYELHASHPGTIPPTRFRTLSREAPEEGFKVVVASCYYDFFHRDADYLATLKSTYCKGTAFKLLIGDNLYLDIHPDQRYVGGGYEETVALYLRYFWHSGYADVLAHSPNFTTWDDHEFWDNYPERQCHLSRTSGSDRKVYERAGHECLRFFQAVLNQELPGGNNLSYRIEDTPVVSFFIADMRSARTRFKGSPRRIIPEEALTDLEKWASVLTRPGVLVVGQPLWIGEGGTGNSKPPDFADQYERIWRAIAGAPHDILIVSGDVHHSRILEIGLGSNRSVYEFVNSPACHVPKEASIAGGGYGIQGRGKVKVPESVPVGKAWGPTLKPRLLRYLFGTSVPNTIGVLKFRANPNGKVSVGCTFLDCLKRGPAKAEPLKINSRKVDPAYRRCYVEELFHLT